MAEPVIELEPIKPKAVKRQKAKAIKEDNSGNVYGARGNKPRQLRATVRAYVTFEMVQRVGERMGRGLTMDEAVIIDEIELTTEEYRKQMDRNRVFQREHVRQMALFVDDATKDLRKGDAPGEKKANGIQFLLERRRPQEWAKKPDVQITNNTLVAGLPRGVEDSLVKRINELAAMPAIPIEHHKTKE